MGFTVAVDPIVSAWDMVLDRWVLLTPAEKRSLILLYKAKKPQALASSAGWQGYDVDANAARISM